MPVSQIDVRLPTVRIRQNNGQFQACSLRPNPRALLPVSTVHIQTSLTTASQAELSTWTESFSYCLLSTYGPAVGKQQINFVQELSPHLHVSGEGCLCPGTGTRGHSTGSLPPAVHTTFWKRRARYGVGGVPLPDDTRKTYDRTLHPSSTPNDGQLAGNIAASYCGGSVSESRMMMCAFFLWSAHKSGRDTS